MKTQGLSKLGEVKCFTDTEIFDSLSFMFFIEEEAGC